MSFKQMAGIKWFRQKLDYHWFHKVTVPRYLGLLGPGKVAIDCGANIGLVTAQLAATGATVHAFEPHPEVFQKLVERTRDMPNVICHQAAVGPEAGRAKLYMHADFENNPDAWAASSLRLDKGNVSADSFVEVDVVSLTDFIADHGPVTFLKIDIEGAEYDVLNSLLDTGRAQSVEQIAVEIHTKAPEMKFARDRLVERITREKIPNIDLGWR